MVEMSTWTGKKIKALRRRLGVTQKDFGERLGITTNYVYLLESEQKTPGTTLQLLLDCVKKNIR
jgi:DNA-binding transcriptional regulator YiaG